MCEGVDEKWWFFPMTIKSMVYSLASLSSPTVIRQKLPTAYTLAAIYYTYVHLTWIKECLAVEFPMFRNSVTLKFCICWPSFHFLQPCPLNILWLPLVLLKSSEGHVTTIIQSSARGSGRPKQGDKPRASFSSFPLFLSRLDSKSETED